MSFILDALKKSESDRQRQSGPALFEVKVAPPRARFPPWAIALAVLLGVNMIVVGWLLLRRPSHAQVAAPATVAANPTPAYSAPSGSGSSGAFAPRAAGAPGTVAPGTANTASSASPNTAPALSYAGSAPAPAATATTPPPGTDQNSYPRGTAPEQPPPGATAMAANPPVSVYSGGPRQEAPPGSQPSGSATRPAPVQTEAQDNPDDYAPATEPAANSPFKSHVTRGTVAGVPLYQDAALAPGANLPQLRLDLHVYAEKPQDRFALINMHRLREGDSLQEGLRVESIIPEGVILSHNGSKFLLPRQ